MGFRNSVLLAAFALCASSPLAGCSKSSGGSGSVAISLSSNDQMQFDKKVLKAKAGQKVKLTLKHTGTMKKEVMGHNFVLLKQGTDFNDFATKAATAKATGYIPAELKGAVIANTKVIGGGESASVEFTAPAAGTYKFLCSFPGHVGMMQGDFVVE